MTSSAATIEALAADWIARRDGDRWTPDEQQAFDEWLTASPAHRVAYLRLNAAWQRADRLRALRPSGPLARQTGQPQQLVEAIGQRKRARTAFAWNWRIAAGIAAVAIVMSMTGDPDATAGRRLYATPLGARETVALDDGSRLTLNTATRLSTRIDTSERMVWLQDGEAFFDVAHDPSRPFVIVAGERRVTVVGTRFVLRRDGDRLRVDVVDGRVRVQVGNADPIVLTRGESAVGEGKSLLVTKRTERQSVAATSWLQGRLVFDQMTLADAAAQFNRYNRKKLVIADPAAAGIRIGGSFDALNAEGFVRLVQSGFGLAIDWRDDRIVISTAR